MARWQAVIFEFDGLLALLVIAWIVDRAVIDRILPHRAKAGRESSFEARGPSPPG